MKVLCQRIVNPVTGEEETHSSWLTIGKEYVVLELIAVSRHWVEVRIIDDSGTPGLHEIDHFVTVSNRIPSNWVMQVGENGMLAVRPESWLRPGFWEDFFDEKPEARALFLEELRLVEAEA